MRYKNIFFDLDGTVINSYVGVTNGIRKAFDKMGMPQRSEEEIRTFLGPPLFDSFYRYCHDREKSIQMVAIFRDYYDDHDGMYECEIYDGIEELFDFVKSNAGKIFIATHKPKEPSQKILDRYGLIKYVDDISGGTDAEVSPTKGSIIKNILVSQNITDMSECIMIGDKGTDAEGAIENNMDFIFANYGFGKSTEIDEIKDKIFIVNKVLEIKNIIEKK